MRLTLRTLLAYLDDLLEPSQAKQIGIKLRESPDAQSQMARIKEVVRRRRLTPPPPEGEVDGMDANHVAEYLDNVLPPDAVVEVERRCLRSDDALAEVAAAHQILSLTIADPIDVAAAFRSRLYTLEAGSKPPKSPETSAESVDDTTAPAAGRVSLLYSRSKPAVAKSSPPPSSFELQLPDHLRPKLGINWFIPLGIGALGVIAVTSYYEDLSRALSSRPSTPSVQVEPVPAEGQATAEGSARPNNPDSPASTGPEAEMPAPAIASTANNAAPSILQDPPPPADEPADAAAPTPATVASTSVAAIPANSVKPSVPEVAAPAMVAAKPNPPVDGGNAPATLAPPPSAPPPAAPLKPAGFGPGLTVKYSSPEGSLLRSESGVRDWTAVARSAELPANSWLAAPEPFECLLDLGMNETKMTLLPATRAKLEGASGDIPAALDVFRGRVIFGGARGEGKGLSLGLRLPTGMGRLDATTVNTSWALEATVQPPMGRAAVEPADSTLVMLSVTAGVVRWTAPDQPPVDVRENCWMILAGPGASNEPAVFSLSSKEGRAAPDWLDPQRRRLASVLRKYAIEFESELKQNQPAELTAAALVRTDRPKLSELATIAVGVMGDVANLSQVLAQGQHEEARTAAAHGLREWISKSPAAAAQIRDGLRTLYSEAQAKTVEKLLWGYSDDDARDAIASRQLVDLLRSDRTEVREMALAELVRLTNGKRFDFRPLAAPAARNTAITRWENFLEKEGGTLVRP